MLTQIKGLFLTDTGKDVSIVFAGTIINALVGGVFFILAPRILGPAQYGLFAVAVSTGVLIAGLANLGIDTGILRFIKVGNDQSNQRILKLALQAYITIGLIIFVLGFLVAKPLATILGNSNLVLLLRIAFSGTIFLLLTDFFVATLQSRRQFLKASLVNIISNVARLLIIVIAAYLFTLNVYFLTSLFFFVTIVSVIIGKIFVPLDFLKAKDHLKEFKNFFSYNSWIAASLAISSIPIDNYLLIKFAGPVATGIYAAPFKILSIVDQLSGNFSRVLASRFSSFDTDEKAIDFAKKSYPIVLVVGGCFLAGSLLATPIIKLLLGNQYLDSIVVFRIIALASILSFATSIPVSIIAYYFGKSKVAFTITCIIILVWSLASFILIPRYHELGAAAAYLIGELIAFCLFTLYVLWKFLRKNDGRY